MIFCGKGVPHLCRFRKVSAMVIFISGASHTGKTLLAQRLLEKYKYPYLSIDHLKMGLIRSGKTRLTPYDDDKMTGFLWPILLEMAKTAVENRQNLIIEGCYIPFDWRASFSEEYLKCIRHVCLIMSEGYIEEHFEDIKAHSCDIERRLDDSCCTKELLLRDNRENLRLCRKYGCEYILIDGGYDVDFDL